MQFKALSRLTHSFPETSCQRRGPGQQPPEPLSAAPQIVVRILYTTLGQLARIAKPAQESFFFATVRLMLSGGYAGEELKHPVFPEPGLAEGSIMKVPGHRFPWQ